MTIRSAQGQAGDPFVPLPDFFEKLVESDGTVTLGWTLGVDEYEIEWWDVDDKDGTIQTDRTSQSEYRFVGSKFGKTYAVRARPINLRRGTGPWSGQIIFSYPAQPETVPEAVEITESSVFEWPWSGAAEGVLVLEGGQGGAGGGGGGSGSPGVNVGTPGPVHHIASLFTGAAGGDGGGDDGGDGGSTVRGKSRDGGNGTGTGGGGGGIGLSTPGDGGDGGDYGGDGTRKYAERNHGARGGGGAGPHGGNGGYAGIPSVRGYSPATGGAGGGGAAGLPGAPTTVTIGDEVHTAKGGSGGSGGGGGAPPYTDLAKQPGTGAGENARGGGGGAGGSGGKSPDSESYLNRPGGNGGAGSVGLEAECTTVRLSGMSKGDRLTIAVGAGGVGGEGGGGGEVLVIATAGQNHYGGTYDGEAGSEGATGAVGSAGRVTLYPIKKAAA